MKTLFLVSAFAIAYFGAVLFAPPEYRPPFPIWMGWDANKWLGHSDSADLRMPNHEFCTRMTLPAPACDCCHNMFPNASCDAKLYREGWLVCLPTTK